SAGRILWLKDDSIGSFQETRNTTIHPEANKKSIQYKKQSATVVFRQHNWMRGFSPGALFGLSFRDTGSADTNRGCRFARISSGQSPALSGAAGRRRGLRRR